MFRKSLKLNSSGDTIVEVLVALAIIAVILAGAFAVSNQSRINIRDSEERAEALHLVQDQVEKLRALSTDQDSVIFDTARNKLFCLDNNIARKDFSSSTLPSLKADSFTQYPTGCKDVQQLYNISVQYDDSSDLFTVKGRWYRVGGGKDEVVLFYRLHKS